MPSGFSSKQASKRATDVVTRSITTYDVRRPHRNATDDDTPTTHGYLVTDIATTIATDNKSQLQQREPRDALHHANRAVHKAGR